MIDNQLVIDNHLALLDRLCDDKRNIETQIGVLAATLVIAKMDEHGVDEFDVVDENGDDFSYVIIDDAMSDDDDLNDIVGWVPTHLAHNEGGIRGAWNPKLRRADLERHIHTFAKKIATR